MPTMPLTASEQQTMLANPWFASLPPALRRTMLQAGERQRLSPGAMLFRQGDAPGAYFGLLSGALRISSLRSDGLEAILVVLEPGNWFGEISLLDGSPRTHDATAIGAVDLLAVPQAAFVRLMRNAGFAVAISGLLAQRVRALYGMVEDATLRGTRARVARRLLLLTRGDATQAAQARRDVPVSQESLAMMLGISRQTLSKELKALCGERVIALGYRRVRIVDPVRLARIGDGRT